MNQGHCQQSICSLSSYGRNRTEGGAGGALAHPLFYKNKNKLNKKQFNKNNGAKNRKTSLIRKWPELLAKTNAQINRHI